MSLSPVVDDTDFVIRLDRLVVDCLSKLERVASSVDSDHSITEISMVCQRVVGMKAAIASRQLPNFASRRDSSICRIILDGWDPEDDLGNEIFNVVDYYTEAESITVPNGYRQSADVEMSLVRLSEQIAQFINTFVGRNKNTDTDPSFKPMPHRPDSKSLVIMQEAAQEQIQRQSPQVADLNAYDRFMLGQQHLIDGLVDHFKPATTGAAIVPAIRRGVRLLRDGIEAGYQAHIWDLTDLFHQALAVREDEVCRWLMKRARDTWNLDRTRPVPWLGLRLLACFELFDRKDAEALRTLEEHRIGVFVDKLPSELDEMLPELQTFHHLLVAIAGRKAEDFNHHLAEREAFRAKYFDGNLAPIALCDLHGLSLCRLARERGIEIDVRHIYLPLDLLDVAPD